MNYKNKVNNFGLNKLACQYSEKASSYKYYWKNGKTERITINSDKAGLINKNSYFIRKEQNWDGPEESERRLSIHHIK